MNLKNKLSFRPRKVVASGNSLWISLPVEFLNYSGIKKGDLVSVALNENGTALILELVL